MATPSHFDEPKEVVNKLYVDFYHIPIWALRLLAAALLIIRACVGRLYWRKRSPYLKLSGRY